MRTVERAVNSLKEIDKLEKQNKLGNCRVWCSVAFGELKAQLAQSEAEVDFREVKLEPGLNHTFLRISSKSTGETYLLDGVGTARHRPFFGEESDAPKHLKDHKRDMLNSYLEW